MKTNAKSYHGYRFPPEIISHGVWLYHRFALSFRDVEELLAKRGIIVTYETVRQWCRKFGPEYARNLKRRQGRQAVAAGDGQAEELRRRSPHDDAFRRAQHNPLCEQSSGSLASTDATTRAADATLQVSWPGTAISVRSRRCPEFVQTRAPPSPFGELPTVTGSLFQRLEWAIAA